MVATNIGCELGAVEPHPQAGVVTVRAVDYFNFLPFHRRMSDRDFPEDNEGVFKKARPARPQLLGRAERTEEYVSTAKGRERRWRHFSTLPVMSGETMRHGG
jgi:hypothetical protein